ncbi:farnesol dehydrogenase-like [Sitophilus oryzae]|uniref:Farnesol dehydrogenase-like n=1 Tax=Sitophilus oryzae TaxID=7048 RepID=A0A6J2Y3W9_SITOR|nr:farnesol dehydrogenase-like [Sitophilus oryzae]
MSLERFVGKVAVVTGASAGIGKAAAEALVKQGLIVAGLARRLERLNEIELELKNEKGKFHPFQCDLTSEHEIISSFKKITQTLGPVHVLINNAGVAPSGNIIDGDISKWRQIIDTNILALCIATREAISSMQANNIKGHIIHVNSVAGHEPLDIPSGLSIYGASKYAVTALTESLRREINRNKLPIKITSLSPGYVKTEMINTVSEDVMNFYTNLSGLEVEDLADNIVYILSTPEHVNIKELTVVVQGDPVPEA